MSGRLRDCLNTLLGSMSFRLRRGGRLGRSAVIKGNMRRVIVVKPPNSAFKEAVFIVNDDYFLSPGVSRQELLRQARRAAEEYVEELESEDSPSRFGPAAVFFICGCALTVLFLYALGLLS